MNVAPKSPRHGSACESEWRRELSLEGDDLASASGGGLSVPLGAGTSSRMSNTTLSASSDLEGSEYAPKFDFFCSASTPIGYVKRYQEWFEIEEISVVAGAKLVYKHTMPARNKKTSVSLEKEVRVLPEIRVGYKLFFDFG